MLKRVIEEATRKLGVPEKVLKGRQPTASDRIHEQRRRFHRMIVSGARPTPPESGGAKTDE